MKSQISYFNKTVFLKTLRRFWPIWALYALLWFLFLPLTLLNPVRLNVESSVPASMLRFSERILNASSQIAPILCFFFSLISVMAVFAWLYNTRSVCFHAALPVPREALLLSPLAAAFASMVAVHLLISLCALLITLSYGISLPECCALFFCVSTLLTVAFLGFFSFCAVLTSNLFILPLAALILSFTAAVVEALCRYLIHFLCFGLGSGDSVLTFLSPLWFLANGGTRTVQLNHFDALSDAVIIDGYAFSGWTAVIGYAFSGIAFVFLTLLLFRRRSLETAGDVLAFASLRPVFRVALSLAMALCGSVVVFSSVYDGSYSVPGTLPRAILLIVIMSIFALIGWFAADMLIYKRLRVFTLHGKGAAVFCTLLAALVLGCEFDLFGFEKQIPEPENVAAVQIFANGENVVFTERENIGEMLDIHRRIILHKAVHEDVSDYTVSTCKVTYYADTELTQELLTREYRLRSTDEFATDPGSDICRIQALFNSHEGIRYRKSLPFAVTEDTIRYAEISPTLIIEDQPQHISVQISAEEAAELYNSCILPDMEDGTIGRIWIVTDESFEQTILNYSIHLDLQSRQPDGEYRYAYFYTVPTVDSYRTNAWLEVHGFPIETEAEAMQRIGVDY